MAPTTFVLLSIQIALSSALSIPSFAPSVHVPDVVSSWTESLSVWAQPSEQDFGIALSNANEEAALVVRQAATCPSVWTTIASDLKSDFGGGLLSGGPCNQNARSAIRFAFHDAAGFSVHNAATGPASGGADGSLLLNDTEIARPTENPMQSFRKHLLEKYNNYKSKGVGAADFVQFAGTVGFISCSNLPPYQTVVGRIDDSRASPDGNLPAAFGANASYPILIQLWADKGFSPRELAALMGAHTVSRSFAQQANGVPPNGPQDSTPDAWDNGYFSQMQAKVTPQGVFPFTSDVNLANPTTACGQAFTEFAGSQASWNTAFAAAMYKLSVTGIPAAKVQTLIDCTSVLQ